MQLPTTRPDLSPDHLGSPACPICASPTAPIDGVDYCVCSGCGAQISTAPPSAGGQGHDGAPERASEKRQRERAYQQVEHLRRLLHEIDASHADTPLDWKVLELGCSTGLFVEEANAAGFDTVGLDVSEIAVETARRRGLADRVFPGEAGGQLPEGCEGPYDVVAAWELLEHSDRPHELLEAAAQHVRPGGWILGSTPNGDSSWRGVAGSGWHGYGIPEHHRVYLNGRAFTRAAERAGLEPCCTLTITEQAGPFLLKNLATAAAERLTHTRSKLVRASFALTLALPQWLAEHTAGKVKGIEGDTLLFAARRPLD